MRNIFIVNAWIVDSTNAFHILDNYPKSFDSNSYSGDIDKALKRARGEYHEVGGAFCKRDDRILQTVTCTDIYGNQMEPPFTVGRIIEEEQQG